MRYGRRDRLVFRREQPDLGDILAAVFPLVYPLLPILLLLGMCKLPQPYDLVGWVLTLLSSVAVDMFAYIFGRLLGKRKLCPHISPNKTIAGAVGGLVSGIAVMVAAGWVCRLLGVPLPWWFILAAAVLCCVAAQLGDLIASMIKRACGVKDFGTILPCDGRRVGSGRQLSVRRYRPLRADQLYHLGKGGAPCAGSLIPGSTGSICRQALEVVDAHPGQFQIVALAACSNAKRLWEQAWEIQPPRPRGPR